MGSRRTTFTFFVCAAFAVSSSVGCRRSTRAVGSVHTAVATGPRVFVQGPTARATNTVAPDPGSCLSVRHALQVTHQLARCPADIVARVTAWRPDALIVLGGGLLPDDEPDCATAQRAAAAEQLFESLSRAPMLVLSGWGPTRAAIALDNAERVCLEIRENVHAIFPRGAMREADAMCAAILRRYTPDQWGAVASRMRFEPLSESTVENAEFSTSVIERNRLRRVLVISTPVVHPRGDVDNHPARALADFRAARGGASFRLAAIGCPFVNGGPAWSEFD